MRFLCGATEVLKQERWVFKSGGGLHLSRQQLPLKLAWAISIHKSQVSTGSVPVTQRRSCSSLWRPYCAFEEYLAMEDPACVVSFYWKNDSLDSFLFNWIGLKQINFSFVITSRQLKMADGLIAVSEHDQSCLDFHCRAGLISTLKGKWRGQKCRLWSDKDNLIFSWQMSL